MATIIRESSGYKIEKVKRDVSGSYAIIFENTRSVVNFNSDTVRYFMKLTDTDFVKTAKEILSEQ